MERDFIFFKKEKGSVFKKVKYTEISYISSNGDYCEVKFINGTRAIIHSTVGNTLNVLPETIFQRCHRFFVVNIHEISSIEENTIYLNSSTAIPIGESYKNDLYEKLGVITNFKTNINEK